MNKLSKPFSILFFYFKESNLGIFTLLHFNKVTDVTDTGDLHPVPFDVLT